MPTTFTHKKDHPLDVDVSYAFKAEHIDDYLEAFKLFLCSIGFSRETVDLVVVEDAFEKAVHDCRLAPREIILKAGVDE